MKHTIMLMTALMIKFGKIDIAGKDGTIDVELSAEEIAATQHAAGWDLEQKPGEKGGIVLRLKRRMHG